MLRLVLEHEDPHKISRAEMDRRLGEYLEQLRAKARSFWDLDVTDYRRAARAVFDAPPLDPAPPAVT